MTVIAELKHCDIVFRGATITNCTGAPRFTADVATDDDRISAVGDLGAVAADEDAPAAGRVLAPASSTRTRTTTRRCSRNPIWR
ncbi:hypothetical protein ABTZ57_43640 [Streptomyces sp. NPDC094048]|uniref:hypothetical protein n=1 Tax=Streptomyces sp. NPDC094048 TaxID=3155207 RepID=UPI00332908AA